jgi:glycine cleavage system H lipoate-binding protein/ABC-type phosphate transport system substrate-binding protein
MKRTIILLISLLLLNYSKINSTESENEIIISHEDSLGVLCTPDLFKLTNIWAIEYNRLYPQIKIKVISVSDTKMADKLITDGNIGFVSNDYYSGFNNQSLWKVVVGRDVIVPVVSSKNPLIDEINTKGISPQEFVKLFENPDTQNWGTIMETKLNKNVNYYWINDESIKKGIAGFLQTDQIKVTGTEVKESEEMILAIQKDPYAIGFCKMINTLDLKNKNIAENIRLLPIDRNGNGIIDYNEKIYDDYNIFSRGVWIGKYPKALFSNIYSVSSNLPKNESEVAFLKWVLTDGQQYLSNNGYSDLLISERQTTVDKLNYAKTYAGTAADDNTFPKIILLILASLIITGLVVDASIRFLRRKKTAIQIANANSQPVFNENSVLVPKGLYFDKTHTWAFMEQNGIVKVGIDDFLQHITGTITRIKMKSQGKRVKKGEQILSIIQNGKQLNLYAPISGIILEQNKSLDTNSSIINSSPYTDGWIYKIEPTNWHRENQLLFMADKQIQFIKNEFSRLRDFFAAAIKADTEKYAQVILQDGGELKEGILSNLGPEIWEDFQTNFIDPSRQLWFYEIF